jgi:hypothetical protein
MYLVSLIADWENQEISQNNQIEDLLEQSQLF